jgi:HJR/Mrr/RecB family endonuclease
MVVAPEFAYTITASKTVYSFWVVFFSNPKNIKLFNLQKHTKCIYMSSIFFSLSILTNKISRKKIDECAKNFFKYRLHAQSFQPNLPMKKKMSFD